MKYGFLLVACLLVQACQFPAYSTLKLYEKDGKLMGVLPLVNGKVLYRKMVNTEALPKEEVFRRARRWCVFAYRSAKDVLQLVDKETGEIIGKGYSIVEGHQIYHTIVIDVHEDSYEVVVRDLDFFVPAHISSSPYISSTSERHIALEQYNLGTERAVIELFRGIDTDIATTIKGLTDYVQNPKP